MFHQDAWQHLRHSVPTRFSDIKEALNAGQCVPQQIIRACSGFKDDEGSVSFKNGGSVEKKMVVRIRTALAELIYIPSISNLMLLEEGLSLSPPDFDQIYNTCLSTQKYSPPRIEENELMYNFLQYLRFFLCNNPRVNAQAVAMSTVSPSFAQLQVMLNIDRVEGQLSNLKLVQYILHHAYFWRSFHYSNHLSPISVFK